MIKDSRHFQIGNGKISLYVFIFKQDTVIKIFNNRTPVKDIVKYDEKQDDFDKWEKDLKLFLGLMISGVAQEYPLGSKFSYVLERSVRDCNMLSSISHTRHIRYAFNIMLENKVIFFDKENLDGLDGKTEEEKDSLFKAVTPYAQLLWLFCVLLCRELFEGDHYLSPNDAQLLGLIDEVAGGGAVKSIRKYLIEKNKQKEQ